MLVGMKCLNEEKSVKRCVGDFHDEPFVDRIIVIDGGSTDYTVQELKNFPKVEVYIHPWLDWYHNMEVVQSNILLSYIPQDTLMMIMDFDERMSEELKTYLALVDHETSRHKIPPGGIVHFSRRTFELMRYANSPYAMIGEDSWCIRSHQIGQYPDFQCRLLRKDFAMHWINSPHHQLMGAQSNQNVMADIIHFEKEDYRDRIRIEKKWAREQARRKELGLTADVFESSVKPEIAEFYEPEGWHK